MIENRVGQLAGTIDTGLVKTRLVERHQAARQRRVVVEIGIEPGLAVAIGMEQPFEVRDPKSDIRFRLVQAANR